MAPSIGTIKQVNGIVIARNIIGEERVLKTGDSINFEDTISTIGAGSHAVLSLVDGREITIGGNDGIFLDKSVYVSESFGVETTVASKTIDQVISENQSKK